jgi:membrane protein required for colicin V production
MASSLGGVPVAMGTVAASMVAFIIVWVALRWAVAKLLRHAMSSDEEPEDRSVDRNLGMALAAVKVAAAAYVLLCALVFAERNVSAFGKRMGVSPKDSIAFDIARRHNLFEMTQFAQVKDVLKAVNAASDPKQAEKMKSNPAYAALQKDPRWHQLISDAEVQKAVQQGDAQALLKSNAVMKALQDGSLMEQLEKVAAAAER